MRFWKRQRRGPFIYIVKGERYPWSQDGAENKHYSLNMKRAEQWATAFLKQYPCGEALILMRPRKGRKA